MTATKDALPAAYVCAGGGGVGKTTTSAGLALCLARGGKRVLLVTVDPARRLADALGVAMDERVHRVDLPSEVTGALDCLMPDPQRSMDTFADVLFRGRAEDAHRIKANPIYRAMATGAASMHEIVSLVLLADAVEQGSYDVVVLDTAPSRNALDFLSYPARLASLFEGRAVGWLAGVADRVSSSGGRTGLFAGVEARVEGLFARIVRPQLLRELAGLFAELGLVKDRFAALSRIAERVLLGPKARPILVAGPTSASVADVRFLAKRLERLGATPRVVVMNRADENAPAWLGELDAHAASEIAEGLTYARETFEGRVARGAWLDGAIKKALPSARRLRLPTIDEIEPAAVVERLASELKPKLELLG